MQRRKIIKKVPYKEEYLQGEKVYLKDFEIKKEDIIHKGVLVELAKKHYVFLKSDCTFYPKFKPSNSNNIFVHRGDYDFDQNVLKKYEKEYKKIFTVNCKVEHEKVYPIPLGLTDPRWSALIGDLDIIIEFNKLEKEYINLAYINFNCDRVDVGLSDRKKIKDLFAKKDWATDGKFERTKDGHREFIKNIYHHKFVFCPRGNGVDTHRLWMSLYLRTIPIVKKDKVNLYFRHLPIVFIDEWEEVNKEFLEQKYEEISKQKYDMSIMKTSFIEELFKS